MKTKLKTYALDKPEGHKILWILLFGFFLNYSWIARVCFRCFFDGQAFQWSNIMGIRLREGEIIASTISGYGFHGHFFVLLSLTILFLAILYLGFRRPDGFFVILISSFLLVDFFRELQNSIYFGENYRIIGETAGIDISYAFWGPAFSAILFFLAVYYGIKQSVFHFKEFRPAWTERNKAYLWAMLLLIPVNLILLRSGEQHGLSDKLGIVGMYIQFILLLLALMPRKKVVLARVNPATEHI